MRQNNSTRNGKIALLRARKYKGIASRVAERLGVRRATVSQVVSGKRTSRRISNAVAAEMKRMDADIAREASRINRDSAA